MASKPIDTHPFVPGQIAQPRPAASHLDRNTFALPVLNRVWLALCAGRAPGEVAMRLGAAGAIAVALWLSACLFMVLEPVA